MRLISIMRLLKPTAAWCDPGPKHSSNSQGGHFGVRLDFANPIAICSIFYIMQWTSMMAFNHTLVVVLTGGIASGKSTVQKLFEGFGSTVFDADLISRDLVA